MTSNSPLPVFEDGLNWSGIRGTSNGGSCDRFPLVLTVVLSNIILIPEVPVRILSHEHSS